MRDGTGTYAPSHSLRGIRALRGRDPRGTPGPLPGPGGSTRADHPPAARPEASPSGQARTCSTSTKVLRSTRRAVSALFANPPNIILPKPIAMSLPRPCRPFFSQDIVWRSSDRRKSTCMQWGRQSACNEGGNQHAIGEAISMQRTRTRSVALRRTQSQYVALCRTQWTQRRTNCRLAHEGGNQHAMRQAISMHYVAPSEACPACQT